MHASSCPPKDEAPRPRHSMTTTDPAFPALMLSTKRNPRRILKPNDGRAIAPTRNKWADHALETAGDPDHSRFHASPRVLPAHGQIRMLLSALGFAASPFWASGLARDDGLSASHQKI